LSFTTATNPDDAIGGVTTVAGNFVNDFVVCNDGTTIYAATVGGVRKSIDGGKTWGLNTAVFAVGTSFDQIAVCPDNPNFVAVMDSTGAGRCPDRSPALC